ncbi:hypothetical protein APHAL10511_004332 [Amanita phalloides]|nr:hypothetical protein APHAL10511_004332 [Amanita phalloides]
MSNKAIVDYLTKQLYIERTIVTYRSLSREFDLHVNNAKNELAKFHAEGTSLSHPVQSFATYFVTGELPTSTEGSSQNDDDDDNPFTDDEEEDRKEADSDFEYGGCDKVTQVQMSLVSEENLELMKAQYKKIYSIHVYSLTPSPLRDPRLLCSVAEQVRESDSNRSVEMATAVGRIVNPMLLSPDAGILKPDQVPVARKTERVAKVEKQREKPKVDVKPVEKPKAEMKPTEKSKTEMKPAEKSKMETKPAEKAKEKPKPSGTGKVDFFKPRPKETKKEETSKAEAKKLTAGKAFFSAPKKEAEQQDDAAATRGTKRKSIPNSAKSETDDDVQLKPVFKSKPQLIRTSSTSARPGAKVKNSVIMSEDEEDVPRISRRKNRISAKVVRDVDSEAEKAARALMDIDDEQITKASHAKTEKADVGVEEDLQDENEDVVMEEEELVKIKPKPRKPKKTVPVGRNGLKKKRVIKSRTTIDERGYMATEDYSSYESVGGEEMEGVAVVAKGKGKGGDKAARGKGKGQASLVTFFGPPKPR